MKIIYFILFSLFTLPTFSQNQDFVKPDYVLIEKNVKDKDSPYHFKKLFNRYTKADTTMTLEEKRHLYYGYSFQEEYSPYERPATHKDLNEILAKEELTKSDYEKILLHSASILKEYPFSVRMKEYRIFSYKELGMHKEAENETLQASMILDAILSSGDGTTKEKSFYVINAMNEYELLYILGFEFDGQQELIDHQYDYLAVSENSYNLKGLYFEVSRSLSTLKF
jgi:hypothetical protein